MTEQLYRCLFKPGSANAPFADVIASTGDDAADKALKGAPGAFITNIAPAPAHLQPHIIAAKAAEKKAA